MCDGASYFQYECDELGSPSPCAAGADAPPPCTAPDSPEGCVSPTDLLPTADRLKSAQERGTCQESDSAADCDIRLTNECVSRARRQDLCAQQDSDNACEAAGISTGLCPSKDRVVFARLPSCRSFLNSLDMIQLGKYRDKGRELEAANSLPGVYKDDDIKTTP